ncbi:GNAT family N-acetyltransferase [Maritalea porphyrae]|uniref:N-acetyltransferase n=1 Tax=Maritalea porphyrae TaxID=880732 RepID=A0ABQ5UT67_9HYPH|nr:GNAT family N-acetyltransferase [Maritalea porphyrae]GLQ17510.1 N-acetyltransferase [Maritalea porphyrae]
MVEIRTQRLVMRPPLLSDADAIHSVLDNYEISKFLSRVEYPLPRETLKDWISRNGPTEIIEDTTLAMFDHNDKYCGVVALDLDEGQTVPELGYYIDVPYWGKGLMSEAASALLEWLFTHSEVNEVSSGAYTFNPASLAIQYKLGFKDVRTEQRICMAQGKELPIVVTLLRRDNFTPIH